MKKELFFLSFVTVLLLSMGLVSVNGITSQEAKTKMINSVNSKVNPDLSSAAIDAIDKTVEGNWTTLDMVTINYLPNSTTINTLNISQYGNDNTEIIINGTEPIPPPPNPCPPNSHLENGICVPDNPQPVPTKIKVLLAGDIDDNKVKTALTNEKADVIFYLGDLEYDGVSEYTPYTTIAKVVKCVLGNHESSDFNSICGTNAWNVKTGKVLWIGINTEGNYAAQKTKIKSFFDDKVLMNNITAIHLLSHMPTESVPPNSHHGLESGNVDLGNYVESLVPSNVLLFRENGHNHVYSESVDGLLKQIGNGGRDLYSCGTNSVWIYCNNDDYGYYKYTVDLNTGETKGNLYGANGQVIR